MAAARRGRRAQPSAPTLFTSQSPPPRPAAAPSPFLPAPTFSGPKPGYAFRSRLSGQGYYLDVPRLSQPLSQPPATDAAEATAAGTNKVGGAIPRSSVASAPQWRPYAEMLKAGLPAGVVGIRMTRDGVYDPSALDALVRTFVTSTSAAATPVLPPGVGMTHGRAYCGRTPTAIQRYHNGPNRWCRSLGRMTGANSCTCDGACGPVDGVSNSKPGLSLTSVRTSLSPLLILSRYLFLSILQCQCADCYFATFPDEAAKLKTRPCQNFAEGFCRFGDRCRFSHATAAAPDGRTVGEGGRVFCGKLAARYHNGPNRRCRAAGIMTGANSCTCDGACGPVDGVSAQRVMTFDSSLPVMVVYLPNAAVLCPLSPSFPLAVPVPRVLLRDVSQRAPASSDAPAGTSGHGGAGLLLPRPLR